MKHRSAQRKVKENQDCSVITYPPGYKGQPLTKELILFSDQLLTCPQEYRGIFTILLKQFAFDMGCGDSERSREYLKAIACGGLTLWYTQDLPAVVFVSTDEECGNTRKRVLKIMPKHQFWKLSGIDDSELGVYWGDAGANSSETPDEVFARVLNFLDFPPKAGG